MAAVSWGLCRRHFPVPYETVRIAGYAGLALALFFGVELTAGYLDAQWPLRSALAVAALAVYLWCAVRWERIDVGALLRAVTGKTGFAKR